MKREIWFKTWKKFNPKSSDVWIKMDLLILNREKNSSKFVSLGH